MLSAGSQRTAQNRLQDYDFARPREFHFESSVEVFVVHRFHWMVAGDGEHESHCCSRRWLVVKVMAGHWYGIVVDYMVPLVQRRSPGCVRAVHFVRMRHWSPP